MSMTPTTLLAKLDELKRWQQTQQERLLKQHHHRLDEVSRQGSSYSENDTIKGLSAFDSFDKNESKEVVNVSIHAKPKRPYLKRGSGLSKFGMKPGDQQKPFNKMKPGKTIFHKRLEMQRKMEKSRNEEHVEQVITPLKVPEFKILPKAKWSTVEEYSRENPLPVIVHEEPSQLQEEESEILDTPDKSMLITIKKLAAERFGQCGEPNVVNEDLLKYLEGLVVNNDDILNGSGVSAYEKKLEKELHIFEELEQKVQNSSFCSTNSSVLQLLSSTPNKIEPYLEKKTVHFSITEPVRQCNVKKSLDFQETVLSENSSITSEDLENRTMQADDTRCDAYENKEEEYTSDTTSCCSLPSSSGSQRIITKQNACVMTDFPDPQDRKLQDEALIKAKVAELELEIATFRTENKKLIMQRNDFEAEKKEFQKAKKVLEIELQEERIKLEIEFEEEKKKLTKEKMVFEKYVKDLQNKPNRKEREEISNLKIELANTKETLKLKETRNGTTQARLRTQIKSLEKDNGNLKDEVEKLQKQNAKLVAAQKVARKPSETKMLHEINKNLTKLSQDVKVNKSIHKMEKSIEKNADMDNSLIILADSRKSRSKRKSGNYESEYQSSFNRSSDSLKENRKSLERKKSSDEESEEEAVFCRTAKSNNDIECNLRLSNHKGTEETNSFEKVSNTTNFDITSFGNLTEIVNKYDRVFGSDSCKTRNSSLNDTQVAGKLETILEDGSKETKYPNGNVKITSADGNLIRLKYFNNDIKETNLLDGSIKYFYAENGVWQTTLVNGNEIFEYSSGQIEKHFSDGSSEISFPDGSIKHTKSDGTENVVYPDGSVVTVNANKEKVLLLPNGQKEIHTKEHKRREYPDGTVKILYPDGLQETRYSNGRIRMKDKDGNLLMDSHCNDA
ncbi:PREDICTED: RING finger protein PFF0165c [Nicrophorus vespilloides]|uniref:RING finger protein PFF0165c n=1 Tax=Nicrophorus vespilloides TaxID=110193 RepID=A0ABM1NJD8_NICVS|nr:PREDICTED: RING finger protein PFF0165c [Nicrophorus vespilloides]